ARNKHAIPMLLMKVVWPRSMRSFSFPALSSSLILASSSSVSFPPRSNPFGVRMTTSSMVLTSMAALPGRRSDTAPLEEKNAREGPDELEISGAGRKRPAVEERRPGLDGVDAPHHPAVLCLDPGLALGHGGPYLMERSLDPLLADGAL